MCNVSCFLLILSDTNLAIWISLSPNDFLSLIQLKKVYMNKYWVEGWKPHKKLSSPSPGSLKITKKTILWNRANTQIIWVSQLTNHPNTKLLSFKAWSVWSPGGQSKFLIGNIVFYEHKWTVLILFGWLYFMSRNCQALVQILVPTGPQVE